ncbi:MAG: T9SS type A sorting domain-containing protein [Candidatus Micrarchaeota archaeon]|nr:T9SS type A sorting domain-containing protein [Candidatus Micrarchaeota archaeon]
MSYTLPKDSHVQVKVFDLFGREVATVVSEREAAGKHEIGFKPDNSLAAGTYICRLEVDGQLAGAKTMVLTK